MAFGNLLAALVVTRSRVLAVALGLVSVCAPLCLTREWPILRTVAAFGLAAGFLRVLQLVHSTAGTTVRSRVQSVVFLFLDARRVTPAAPEVRWLSFAEGAFELAVAVALFLMPYPHAPGVLRTLVAACSAYFCVEGAARIIEAGVAMAGIEAKPLHVSPIRARTVTEFWGRRWNRPVHGWLDEYAFRPVTRRFGVAAGVMAAFGASALLHTIPIWIAFDAPHALAIGAFFVLHGGIVLVEAKLRVARWPPVFGHAWTLGVFAITGPIFLEPLLSSLGR